MAAGPPVPPLEIYLDSPEVVLRTRGQDDPEPAILSGEVRMHLQGHRNEIKDINLTFSGRCRVSVQTSKANTADHSLFFHDCRFLPATSHTHTLSTSSHAFPFSLQLPPDLPPSLRAWSGQAISSYQLRAVVTRPGLTTPNWTIKRNVTVSRGLVADAPEYTQTLEVDSLWPGKVDYKFVLPHKAYAAGAEIPVSIKITHLQKNVKVTSMVTSIFQTITVFSRNNQVTDSKDIATYRQTFNGYMQQDPPSGQRSGPPSGPASATPSRRGSLDFSGFHLGSSGALSRRGSRENGLGPSHSPFAQMAAAQCYGATAVPTRTRRSLSFGSLSGSRSSPVLPSPGRQFSSPAQSFAGPSSQPNGRDSRNGRSSAGSRSDDLHSLEEDIQQSQDIDVISNIKIPDSATPSCPLWPVHVSYKIKWSVYIKNPDGHTSELRVALPLLILSNTLRQEAELASSGTRTLLFGPSGAMLPESADTEAGQLPSYQNHIQDRIASAETPSYFPQGAAYIPTAWSSAAPSPLATPVTSPPISRATTPNHGSQRSPNEMPAPPLPGASTSSGLPTASVAHPHDDATAVNFRKVNWANDMELRSSLTDGRPQPVRSSSSSRSHTPAHTPPVSQPNSRPSSRPNSRPNSRPSSPVLGSRSVSSRSSSRPSSPTGRHHISPLGSQPASATTSPTLAPVAMAEPVPRSAASSLLHFPRPFKGLTPMTTPGTSPVQSHMHVPPVARRSTDALNNLVHGRNPLRSHSGGSSAHPSASGASPAAHHSGSNTGGSGSREHSNLHSQHSLSPDQPGSRSPGLQRSETVHAHVALPLVNQALQDYVSTSDEEEQESRQLLSQVPSYDVASKGFLGGVVPLESNPPDYQAGPSANQ
ncbi:uncharacterized protein L969DRAFT_94455 [Mixia osmundae IAM 14324]|uniref:Arrestin C-terminal-like domain-containing protein n=1 Tax=Mixia osmundae (strain CBS 9802 / IAM 14324 / JCM 22182 / KY 12970) TaxID=764103 RepID=G7E3I9_MIXOS|nr:uncharacterized protein L969DRAFT_94455 [Mixia osmundae IAM 14324]KEI39385.1 hypothetical protein L969DRAFT_94455 [Mixia osmundae IAM 14324]GAA97399.1 hypothetical protein E5Q_04077 [Mixia osmundae IAM 14324]